MNERVTQASDVNVGDECLVSMTLTAERGVGNVRQLYLRTAQPPNPGDCPVNLWLPGLLRDPSVEVYVTRRADHPSGDEVGTVRGRSSELYVKVAPAYPERGEENRWVDVTNGTGRYSDEAMMLMRMPVVHTIPNSPAFDAQARRAAVAE